MQDCIAYIHEMMDLISKLAMTSFESICTSFIEFELLEYIVVEVVFVGGLSVDKRQKELELV